MIPLAVFLLGCAACYLGCLEAAFGALTRLSLRLMAERSDRSRVLAGYLDNPMRLLVPVRLLLGLVTALATACLAAAIGVEGPHTFALVVVSVAAFVVCCELLAPMFIVRRDPERTLEMLLPTFQPLAAALKPLTRALTWAARQDDSSDTGATGEEAPAESDGEATPAPAASAEATALRDGEDRRLLQSIVDFGGTLVREVMTPRPDIVAIRADATIGDLRALFQEQEYSRFPVFGENLDNILGFVFAKDLITLEPSADARPVTTIVRPAVVVPETKRVSELLKQFQRQQVQIGIVVDEYGGTAGLVTIEDMLEEIVGEIRDEYDVESDPIVDEGQHGLVVSGKVNVDEVAQRLQVTIEGEGFETIGGYLLSRLGRVPSVGERFQLDGLSIEVLDAERRRITKVRVARHEPSPMDTAVDARR